MLECPLALEPFPKLLALAFGDLAFSKALLLEDLLDLESFPKL